MLFTRSALVSGRLWLAKACCFGQLFHLLDNELKNIIRNFKKQKKQIISAQYGILFNQTHTYYILWTNILVHVYNKIFVAWVIF